MVTSGMDLIYTHEPICIQKWLHPFLTNGNDDVEAQIVAMFPAIRHS